MIKPSGINIVDLSAASLRDWPLGYVLHRIQAGGFTGVLNLYHHTGPRFCMAFKSGGLKSVVSGPGAEDNLGRLLVGANLISEQQAETAAALSLRSGIRVGEACLRLDLVSPGALERVLQAQMIQRALRAFAERDLVAVLVPAEQVPISTPYTLSSLYSLIVTGIKSSFNGSDAAATYSALLGATIGLRDGFPARLPRYRFPVSDLELLQLLDKPVDFVSLYDRVAGQGGDLPRMLAIVTALHATGELVVGTAGVTTTRTAEGGPPVRQKQAPKAAAAGVASAPSAGPVAARTSRAGADLPRDAGARGGIEPARPAGIGVESGGDVIAGTVETDADGPPPSVPTIGDHELTQDQLVTKRRALMLAGKIDDIDYFELLEIPRIADRGMHDDALNRLRGMFSPSAVSGTPLAPLAPLLAYLSRRIGHAHAVLTEPARRRDYLALFADPHVRGVPALQRRKQRAAELFRQAEAALTDGRVDECVQACREVVSHFPYQPGYFSLLGWALFLQQAEDDPRQALRAGLEWVARAIKCNPTSPVAYATAARMYQRIGDAGRAAAYFEKAAGFAPNPEPYRNEAAKARSQRKGV